MIKNKFSLIFILILFLSSCQKLEVSKEIAFEYKNLPKIVIIANTKEVKNIYESQLEYPYIDYSLEKTPIDYLNQWLEKNISVVGNENSFIVNIIEGSIKKNEIKNNTSKKYDEKTIFLYEINIIASFKLLGNENQLLAEYSVESNRTTTSGKFITILEKEKIIRNLIFDCLTDFTNESDKLIKLYMREFII